MPMPFRRHVSPPHFASLLRSSLLCTSRVLLNDNRDFSLHPPDHETNTHFRRDLLKQGREIASLNDVPYQLGQRLYAAPAAGWVDS